MSVFEVVKCPSWYSRMQHWPLAADCQLAGSCAKSIIFLFVYWSDGWDGYDQMCFNGWIRKQNSVKATCSVKTLLMRHHIEEKKNNSRFKILPIVEIKQNTLLKHLLQQQCQKFVQKFHISITRSDTGIVYFSRSAISHVSDFTRVKGD